MSTMTTLPEDVRTVLDRSLVCEYASLTKDGRPITWPLTAYVGPTGTLDVSTGLAYPDKAERARRNPRVALLYSDPTGLPAGEHPIVLVEGRASVRDADLQANTDRYVLESLARTTGFDRIPWWLVRRFNWYFARIWVQVSAERITWWPAGDPASPPRTWIPEVPVSAGPSDPKPRGPRPLLAAAAPNVDWSAAAARAADLGAPVLTTTVDGRPVPVRARSVRRTADGYAITLPAGAIASDGPACLTFHRAAEGLSSQQNVVLVGTARVVDDEVRVDVDRALTDWSLSGSSRDFLRRGKELKQRLKAEAARRGQPVPVVRRVR